MGLIKEYFTFTSMIMIVAIAVRSICTLQQDNPNLQIKYESLSAYYM